MDITGADFYRVIDMMKTRLNANAVPIQLPIGFEDTFQGMIDLIKMRAIVYDDALGKEEEFVEIPADMKEKLRNTVQHWLKLLLNPMTS